MKVRHGIISALLLGILAFTACIPMPAIDYSTGKTITSFSTGNVTSVGGAAGRIAYYTGANSITSSLITWRDQWLYNDTNTFFGIGVCGAGNLSHAAGITGYENTAFGCDAGSSLLTGYSNTFVGNNAGERVTTGYNNVGIGASVLNNISTADSNVAVGDQAMMNATGGKNTALGKGAMAGADAGEYNTAIGLQSLNTPSGNNNTAIGVWAGQNNSGSNNVFLGYRAGDGSGAVSDKLYIDNSNTATPLIYGDFSTNSLTVNGDLTVTGKLNVTLSIHANNAAAVGAGLAVGTFYRTGGDPDLVCVVH